MLFLYVFAYCFIVIMIDYIYHNIVIIEIFYLLYENLLIFNN